MAIRQGPTVNAMTQVDIHYYPKLQSCENLARLKDLQIFINLRIASGSKQHLQDDDGSKKYKDLVKENNYLQGWGTF